MRSLRGLRGLLGITIAWSIAWIPLGIALGIVEGQVYGRGWRVPGIAHIVGDVPLLATVGAVCGFGFGLVLAAMERRRTIAALSLPRMVAWGVAGSLVIPCIAILTGDAGSTLRGILWSLGIFGIPGGMCAAMTFALVRRGHGAIDSHDAPHALGEPGPDAFVEQPISAREQGDRR